MLRMHAMPGCHVSGARGILLLQHCGIPLRARPQTSLIRLRCMLAMHADVLATVAYGAILVGVAVGVTVPVCVLRLVPLRGRGSLPTSRIR